MAMKYRGMGLDSLINADREDLHDTPGSVLEKKPKFFGLLLISGQLMLSVEAGYAQCVFTSPNCQANMTNGTSANFNALTWTHNTRRFLVN